MSFTNKTGIQGKSLEAKNSDKNIKYSIHTKYRI
jgi:hypothetical protein